MMSTYGTVERMGKTKPHQIYSEDKGSTRETIRYPELIHIHYQHRDAIDSHNARRMDPISLEETWTTSRWPCRVYAYLLATSAVNANKAMNYFGGAEETDELIFRRRLAQQLIFNPHLVEDQLAAEASPSPKRRMRTWATDHHELKTIPEWKMFAADGSFVPSQVQYGG